MRYPLTCLGVCHSGSFVLKYWQPMLVSDSMPLSSCSSWEVGSFVMMVRVGRRGRNRKGGIYYVGCCVIDAGRKSTYWTILLTALGSLTRHSLEVIVCLPFARTQDCALDPDLCCRFLVQKFSPHWTARPSASNEESLLVCG